MAGGPGLRPSRVWTEPLTVQDIRDRRIIRQYLAGRRDEAVLRLVHSTWKYWQPTVVDMRGKVGMFNPGGQRCVIFVREDAWEACRRELGSERRRS